MKTITLDKPHIVRDDSPYLNASREIAGYRFTLDPKAVLPNGVPTGTLGRLPHLDLSNPLTAWGLLTLPPRSRNIRIVDCEFVYPWARYIDIPDVQPGVLTGLCGIDAYEASGIRIEGCAFERVPSYGIGLMACSGVEIEDCWTTSCRGLLDSAWVGARTRWVRVNRVNHADAWSGGWLWDRDWYARSLYEPDENRRTIGQNAIAGWFVDSEFSNVTASGEFFTAMKLVNPVRVSVDRMFTSSFMIQGTIGWNFTNDPTKGNGRLGAFNLARFDESHGWHAQDVTITRSRFRPSMAATVFPSSANRFNTIQLSFRQTGLKFRDCTFYGPTNKGNEDPGNSQIIQAYDGVELDIRDCTWITDRNPPTPEPAPPTNSWQQDGRKITQEGWDKIRCLHWGDYGAPGSVPCTVNTDVWTANRFVQVKPK